MEFVLFLYFTVAILAILTFSPKLRKYLRVCWILRKLPSAKGYPFIGYIFPFFGQVLEDYLDIMLQLTKDIYNPMKMFIGPIPYVLISNPEDMQTLGTAMGCVNKSEEYNFLRVPRSIVTVPADLWKAKRRMITPSFNVQVLQKFIPILNDNVRTMISNIQRQLQSTDGDFRKFIKYCLLKNVYVTTFDYDIGAQSARIFHFLECIEKTEKIISKRLFQFWYRFDVIYRWSKQYQEECKLWEIQITVPSRIIDLKKKEYLEAPETYDKSQVLIYRLVKHLFDGNLTHEEVMDEVKLIIYAGYATCDHVLSNTILMLAMHQDVQEKVLEEIRSVNSTPDAPLSFEDAGKLTYMEMVIKETMRLFPVAPFLGRLCSKDIKLSSGVVPDGTHMVLLICQMHRKERIWGSKYNDFYPEHFLPENVAKRHPYSYAPFGVGIRDCIGSKYAFMSMKMILSAFLKNFKVNIDGVTMADLKTSLEVSICVKQTQDVRITKR